MKVIKSILPYLFVICAVLLLKELVIIPVRVEGTSMNPTLIEKEYLILNKLKYSFKEIERFDIVAINYEDKVLVKRIIAMPGESIKYEENKLYINNEVIEEPFLREQTNDFSFYNESKIPEDTYFVLGDNRNNSKDSRLFGLVSKKNILGSIDLIIYPLNEFKIIN